MSGQVAFEEESSRVKPVEAFAETEKGIKEASTRLVFEHLNSFSDQKVIKQRHQVRIVPVTKISYEWKGKLHSYYAYGYENKIHLPQYFDNHCFHFHSFGNLPTYPIVLQMLDRLIVY